MVKTLHQYLVTKTKWTCILKIQCLPVRILLTFSINQLYSCYELTWRGGKLVVVPPQYTSQTCNHCGHTDKANRKTQAQFTCVVCGFEANADAALNILAAGHAVTVGGVGKAQAPTMKQKPAYGAAR